MRTTSPSQSQPLLLTSPVDCSTHPRHPRHGPSPPTHPNEPHPRNTHSDSLDPILTTNEVRIASTLPISGRPRRHHSPNAHLSPPLLLLRPHCEPLRHLSSRTLSSYVHCRDHTNVIEREGKTRQPTSQPSVMKNEREKGGTDSKKDECSEYGTPYARHEAVESRWGYMPAAENLRWDSRSRTFEIAGFFSSATPGLYVHPGESVSVSERDREGGGDGPVGRSPISFVNPFSTLRYLERYVDSAS